MKKVWNFIYDKMLYAYCYVDVFMWQMEDYHKNVNWIKKNGRYNGRK